jgi:hypothetical protein
VATSEEALRANKAAVVRFNKEVIERGDERAFREIHDQIAERCRASWRGCAAGEAGAPALALVASAGDSATPRCPT